MKKFIYLLLFGISLVLNSFCYGKVPAEIISHQVTIAPLLKRVMPAVVNIVSQGNFPAIKDPLLKHELKKGRSNSLLDKRRFASIGSGVIIDAKRGLIVTNAHVVDMAKSILVTLNDGRHFQANKLGVDSVSDLALLQIHANSLVEINLANSDKVKVGDFVAAIGSPFGLNQTATSGIVSGLHRGSLGIEGLENFIQTDAPINMGNSGGALVNMQGTLIGINTALLSPDGGNVGIGFAIPSNMVKNVVIQLMQYGKVRRGLVGVFVQDLTPSLAAGLHANLKHGAVIGQVSAGSPADKVGLKAGDIIVSINGHVINSSGDVHSLVGILRIGTPLKIKVIRDRKIKNFTVKTTNLAKYRSNNPLNGVGLKNVVLQTPEYGYVEGVKVTGIADYSKARFAGLLENDIIVSINKNPVKSVAKLDKIVRDYKDRLLLHVLRNGSGVFVVI